MTEYYVRETGGSDANGGLSHADAWATVQMALDTVDHGQNHRININGSHAEGTLSFASFPNSAIGTIFQGYTSVAGDGGVGTLDGSGSIIISEGTYNVLHFRNMRFINWGAGNAILLDSNNAFIECEFDGEGARVQGLQFFRGNVVYRCRFINFASTTEGILHSPIGGDNTVIATYIQSTGGIALEPQTASLCWHNVISLNSTDAGCSGIHLQGNSVVAINNTVFNRAAGTGAGILGNDSDYQHFIVLNNVSAGFSGTLGIGISIDITMETFVYGYNRFYSNETDEDLTGLVHVDVGGSGEVLTNPFTSTGNADPNDDDWTLVEGIPSWPLQYWNPDGTFADRNETAGAIGALQEEP